MTNLVLALKITADNKELKAEAASSRTELDQLGSVATETATALNTTSAAADRLASGSKQAALGAQALTQSSVQSAAAANANAVAQQRLTQEAARYGMTMGQYQQAQRLLPMQITDVVTSLASGMPVYMVAIQQGGQLRDSYGGVGNAARALSGTIKPMFLGIGAGVGVVAALGAAFLQNYQEMQGYERALLSTGNVVGATAGELAELTDEVGAATGEFESAQVAVLQLAEGGRFTAAQLKDASFAAVNLAQLTGDSIEKTTADIIKLADAPAKHLAELNDQYHFLTLSTYDQIRAYEKQGRTQDAVALSLDTLKRVTDARVKEMYERAGWLERKWTDVGNAISSAWQSVKDLGREDNEYKLEQARAKLARAENMSKYDGYSGESASVRNAREEVRVIEAKIAAHKRETEAKAEKQRADDAGVKSRLEQEKAAEEASKKAQRERESAAKQRVADAERLRQAADTEVAGMQRQIALGEKATQVAKTRYEIEHGAYAALDGARQQALLKEAARVDAYTAAKKNSEDYKSLLEDLQTKEEKLTNQMMQRLTVLDAARSRGAVNDADYNKAAGRAVNAGFEEAPKFGGVAPEVGGAAGELLKANKAEKDLEVWYAKQRDMLAQARQERADLNTQWDAQEQALEQQHQQRLGQIQQAQQLASLSMVEQVTSQSMDLIGQLAGEGSAAYKAMFLVNKAAAIAQAMVNTNVAATAALAYGGPAGPFLSGAITAMGYANVAAIAATAIQGMAHDGISRVPSANEGTWLLKKDEMVLNPTQADNFGTLLNFVNSQQQAAQGGASGGSAGGAGKVTVILRNEGGQALESKVISQQRVGDEERIEIALMTKQMMAQDAVQRGELSQVYEGVWNLRRSGR